MSPTRKSVLAARDQCTFSHQAKYPNAIEWRKTNILFCLGSRARRSYTSKHLTSRSSPRPRKSHRAMVYRS